MTASQMKKLHFDELSTGFKNCLSMHSRSSTGSDKNATADNAEKNAAETAEKEKKHRLQ